MVQQRRYRRLLLFVAFACLVLTVSAKGGGGHGSSGGHSGGGGSVDSGSTSSSGTTGTGHDVDSTSSGSGSTSGSTSSSGSNSNSNSGSSSAAANANDVDYTYYTGTRGGGAFWPGGPAYRPGNSTNGNSGSSANSGFGGSRVGSGGGRNGAAGGPGFDVDSALYYRTIHGILAALAFVVLFPVGSILMRVIPGRFAVWVHAVFQVLAWGVWVAAAGLGIYLVRVVRIPGGGLLQNPSTRYHPIIGLVLLALLIIQPVVGFVHHRVYKKVQKRQVWSYVHLTIGRVGITLGIVNGGLGLYLSNASDYYKRVYAIVGAVMWALWMAVAIWAEIRRVRKSRKGKYEAVAKAPAGETRASQE